MREIQQADKQLGRRQRGEFGPHNDCTKDCSRCLEEMQRGNFEEQPSLLSKSGEPSAGGARGIYKICNEKTRQTGLHTSKKCQKIEKANNSKPGFQACMLQGRSFQSAVCRWYCDACARMKAATHFDQAILRHAKYEGRRRVCLDCTAAGFSARDIRKYPCAECGMKGHRKFARQALRNFKKPGQRAKPICADCIERYVSTRKRLRLHSSWRCTCPKKNSARVHLSSNKYCGLHTKAAEEERWPGKNNGVSREDLDFYMRFGRRVNF